MGELPNAWVESELAAARRDWMELVALEKAGVVIASSHRGELVARMFDKGQAVAAGDPVAEVRAGNHGRADAVMHVSPRTRARIEPGMVGRVASAGNREVRHFPATVVAVSPWPHAPSPWIHRLELASAGAGGRLVRVAVDSPDDVRARDGVPCRFEIVLGRSSFAGLLVQAVARS